MQARTETAQIIDFHLAAGRIRAARKEAMEREWQKRYLFIGETLLRMEEIKRHYFS